MSTFFKDLYNSNLVLLLFVFCLIQWLFNFFNSEYIATDELFDSYIEQRQLEKYGEDYNELAAEFEDDIEDFEDEDEYYWSDQAWDFGIMSVLKLFQFAITSAFIFIGLTLKSETDKFSFKQIFKVVIIAEFIFFIPVILKFIWFGFIDTSFDYTTIRNFQPLSLRGIVGSDFDNSWLLYPLRVINLFEVLFIIILIKGISHISDLEKELLTKPIVLSYSLLLFTTISLRIYLSSLF